MGEEVAPAERRLTRALQKTNRTSGRNTDSPQVLQWSRYIEDNVMAHNLSK